MAHVFISFVEENANLAGWVVRQLRANGLDPWFSKDPDRIVAGDHWKATLRAAIQEGGFYLPIFTKEWAERTRTVANEELTVAVEEARLRGLHRRWFVPLKVDDQPLPAVDFGGGIALSDIQHVNIPQLGWERGMKSLLIAFGVANPTIESGEPLAPGFGAAASIAGGFVTYRNTRPRVAELEGVTFTVTDGWVRRSDDGRIYARFLLRAPFEGLQSVNEQFGLDGIDVRTDEGSISVDPANPTRFYFVDDKDRRAPGFPLWSMHLKQPLRTNVSIKQETGYTAVGYLTRDDKLTGSFEGYVSTASALGSIKVTFDGSFEIALRGTVFPPEG